jgi:WD40 repeat protein
MDGIAILRDQQADFIKRLNSNAAVLHQMKDYKLTGYHSELMVISGNLLNRLQKFYTRQKNDKLPVNHQKYLDKDEFKQKIKSSFSKLIVKQYLDNWIKNIDQNHDLFNECGGNFCLSYRPSFPIIVKGSFGSKKTVSWSLIPDEIERDSVVVFVLIEEDFDRENYQYNLILAGFLPTEMIDRTQPIIRVKIQDLLYGGGLKSYLTSYVTSGAGVIAELPSLSLLNDPETSITAVNWICTQTIDEEKSLLSLAITGDRLGSGQSPKLACAGLDQWLKIWDLSTGQVEHTISEHCYPVFSLDVSPDGQTLAIGSMHETIELWDLGNGDRPPTLQNILEGHSLGVFSLHFTPDGEMLISRSLEESIKIWDLKTGKLIQALDSHAGPVWSEAISPDGKLLATGNLDESIKIWHLEKNSGELNISEVCVLNGHSDVVRCLAFSPNGKFLASGSADCTINLWVLDQSTENLSVFATLKSHTDIVYCLAFSPDGKFLASGSEDHTINIWRLGDRTNNYVTSLEATLTEHSGLVWGLQFTPNGKTLVSGSQDGTIKIWDQC